MKQYLGDGVYVSESDGMIRLTTEDGINITNEIFLEEDVYWALRKFVERTPIEVEPE
jgi:hypothetical protein